MVSQLRVEPCSGPLRGGVPLPSDPTVGMIALALAACARGTSRLRFSRTPEPVRELAEALRRCGASIEEEPQGLSIHGGGLFGLEAPAQVLDARGAPLAASVLAGLLAWRPFASELVVDEEFVEEIFPTLAEVYGAQLHAPSDDSATGKVVSWLPQDSRAPGAAVQIPGARPGAKVALLLAALRASSATHVQEGLASADHCERLLYHLRMPVEGVGPIVIVHPPRDADALSAFEMDAVGDPSAAAYLAAAAALVPESHVTMRAVGLNPSRIGWLDAFLGLGVQGGITPQGDVLGEPVGELSCYGGGVRGGAVAGELATRLGDDFVPVALLGASARQPLELHDLVPGGGPHQSAGQRDIARLVGVLRAFGVGAAPTSSGLVVHAPSGPLRATKITTGGDHRLALAGTVLALRADGPSWIDDVDCLMRFFPRWVGTLRALGAKIEVVS